MKVDIPAGLMYEFGKNSLHSLPHEPLQFSMLVQSQGRIQTGSKGSHKPVKQFRVSKQSFKINYQIPDYKNFEFLM